MYISDRRVVVVAVYRERERRVAVARKIDRVGQ